MMRLAIPLVLLAAMAGGAQADITLKLNIEGKHHTFDKCVFDFEIDTHGAEFRIVDFFYDVYVDGEAHQECTRTFSKRPRTYCTGAPGGTRERLLYLCEEITKIKALGAACYDADENEVDCGEPSLEGPDILTFD